MPPDAEELRGLSDEELAREIARIRETLDRIRQAGGTGDPELEATLNELFLEQQRRKTAAAFERIRAGPTSRTPRDDPIGYGDMRRQGLREWARRLGLPFGLPPGVDLYDDEIFNEIVSDLHSYERLLREIDRRQRRAGGGIDGMDSVDRVIEAFRRAIASGEIDDAVAEQLRALLDPESLKFLPLFVAFGAGLGLLGGAWAILAGLLVAFGPVVYDLVETMYAVITAETEDEFDAAIEALIRFLGGAGADILISVASFAAGRGLRWLRRRTTAARPPRPRRRTIWPGPRSAPAAPRVSPPWLEPPPPRVFDPPDRPRSGNVFDYPYNRRQFDQGAEIIRGQLRGRVHGETSTEGRVIIKEKLKGPEFEQASKHELGHRRLRPHAEKNPTRRSALGRRIGRLLGGSPLMKILDEVFAAAHETDELDPQRMAERMHELFASWRSDYARLTRRDYGVDLDRLEREIEILSKHHKDLARKLRDPAEILRRLDKDTFDLDAFIREFEDLYDTIQRELGVAGE